MSGRFRASPSARMAARPVTVPPATRTSSSRAWRLSPVEITSSTMRMRLPFIMAQSSLPRNRSWVRRVVMERTETWMGSGM